MRRWGSTLSRRTLVAVLTLILTFAGIARVLAQAPGIDAGSVTIAGVVIPICHPYLDARDSAPGSPAPIPTHDCCGACALCAAVALPGLPGLAAPPSFARAGRTAIAALPTPRVSSARTPRQSQAPPIA